MEAPAALKTRVASDQYPRQYHYHVIQLKRDVTTWATTKEIFDTTNYLPMILPHAFAQESHCNSGSCHRKLSFQLIKVQYHCHTDRFSKCMCLEIVILKLC